MTEEDLKAQNPSVTSDVQTKIDKANAIKSIATALLNSPALPAYVGPMSSFLPSWKTVTGETTDFEIKLKQLQGLETLKNMGVMKGVLSDKDMEIIKNASTALNRHGTEDLFKAELNKIIDAASKISPNAKQLVSPESFGSVQSPDGKIVYDYDLTDPAQKAEYDEALKSGYISI
jgi:hypothetical protein